MLLHGAVSPVLIFTDLDGCLLNHDDYSYAPSLDTLETLRGRVPLIVNSSKTFSEISGLVRQLRLDTPFIFENGSAIAFPQRSAKQLPANTYPYQDWIIMPLARPRQLLLHRLSQLAEHYHFKGFADLSYEALRKLTGLTLEQAHLAKDRLFSEPIQWLDSEESFEQFTLELGTDGLVALKGGRFIHIMDRVDKAIAMRTLQIMLEQQYNRSYTTVALGDSENDRRMLDSANYSCVVRRPNGEHLNLHKKAQVIRTSATGSFGWNEAISILIAQGVIDTGEQ